MIIWSGLGFLVAAIVIGFSLAFNAAFNTWWGDGYYDAHRWPLGMSLFLSAIVCWFLGSALRNRKARTVIDKKRARRWFSTGATRASFLFRSTFGLLFL